MRYLLILMITLLLGACGNKIETLKYAGEKVKQTVSACTETVNAVCPEMEKTMVKEIEAIEKKEPGSGGINASTSWDTHMMLW